MITQTTTPALAAVIEMAEDLTVWDNTHPGIRLLCEGALALAGDRSLTVDDTQTILATIANNGGQPDVIGLIQTLLVALTDPDTNPAIASLPEGRQEDAQVATAAASFHLADPHARDEVANACGAIGGQA